MDRARLDPKATLTRCAERQRSSNAAEFLLAWRGPQLRGTLTLSREQTLTRHLRNRKGQRHELRAARGAQQFLQNTGQQFLALGGTVAAQVQRAVDGEVPGHAGCLGLATYKWHTPKVSGYTWSTSRFAPSISLAKSLAGGKAAIERCKY